MEKMSVKKSIQVPYAKDGSWFSPYLIRKDLFTVGEKGDEQQFSHFADALAHLQKMDKARWRRPNEKGNWGIVSAVSWDCLPEDEMLVLDGTTH